MTKNKPGRNRLYGPWNFDKGHRISLYLRRKLRLGEQTGFTVVSSESGWAVTSVAVEFLLAGAMILTRIAGAFVGVCNFSNTPTIVTTS